MTLATVQCRLKRIERRLAGSPHLNETRTEKALSEASARIRQLEGEAKTAIAALAMLADAVQTDATARGEDVDCGNAERPTPLGIAMLVVARSLAWLGPR